MTAFLTDSSTGELTSTPVDDCGSQSQLPEEFWYDAETNSPVITFADANPPSKEDLDDLPKFLVQTGSFSGAMGEEFPPSPVPNEVQFYRNVATNAPYADVSSAPPKGSPPDACGGYVMANLPNDVVSLVHIPQVPSFPDYTGATESTLNTGDDYDVSFYSIVIYGAEKQLDAFGTLQNSQLGNSQIAQNPDGSATVVLYPDTATQDQIDQIAAVVKANGWNLLKSGKQTDLAPNMLVVREKGQNQNWENALSANDVTQGAPCPQSTDLVVAVAAGPARRPGRPDQRHGTHRPGRRELFDRCVPVGQVPRRTSRAARRRQASNGPPPETGRPSCRPEFQPTNAGSGRPCRPPGAATTRTCAERSLALRWASR